MKKESKVKEADTGAKRKCFVLMPFEQSLKEIYTEIFSPICAKRNIECFRVDEISRPGSITRDIIEGIIDADIIIADLSGKNPNVFYELGIAHACSNKTIMTAQRITDVPFDIANYRILLYERTLIGCKKLGEDLIKAIDELLAAIDRTNNPFQEVVSMRGIVRTVRREPIARHLNLDNMPDKIVAFFHANKVHYKEDMTSELFERLAAAPKIGKTSLGRLCSALMRNDFFADLEFLNDFVLKHKVDATKYF